MTESPRPLAFRLWHWLNALALMLSLTTVFLRKTFLSPRNMARVMQQELQQKGVVLAPEAARAAARAVKDGMWDWHFRIGFVLAGLFLIRMFGVRSALPGFSTWKDRVHSIFYLIFASILATGLSLYFAGDLHLSQPWCDGIQEVHEFLLWFVVAFVGVHGVAVIRAELGAEPGIVSRLIHGKKG